MVRGWVEAGSNSSRSNSKIEVNPSSFLTAIRSRVVMLKPRCSIGSICPVLSDKVR